MEGECKISSNFKGMRWVFALLMVMKSILGDGQIVAFKVIPHLTDTLISDDQPDHEILLNVDNSDRPLLVFFGGTGSSPEQYVALRNFAAEEGFTVISLSYMNEVATASLRNLAEREIFGHYREEICFGTPISDQVMVDSANSIHNRLVKLLQYLERNRPMEQWGRFLDQYRQILWSDLILAGHSQGAGHAAYLAKHFAVNRVVMFSGPNDFSNHFEQPAPWLGQMGETEPQRHFAYLSLFDDAVPFEHQLANLRSLSLQEFSDTVRVDDAAPPYDFAHILYTTQNPGLVLIHHNVPVKNSPLNKLVWTYLLQAQETASTKTKPFSAFSIYPNPAGNYLVIESSQVTNEEFQILDLKGRHMQRGQIKAQRQLIYMNRLSAGQYLMRIGSGSQIFSISK